MLYSIKQVAEKTGLSASALRFYDREGLLPLLKRTPGGNRMFSDNDLAWLGLICCLKNSGMPLENLREFMDCCLRGSETFEQRKEILVKHKEHILHQLEQLQKSLQIVDYKIDHYKQIGVFHIDAAETAEE